MQNKIKKQEGNRPSLYSNCVCTPGITCSGLSTFLAPNSDKVEKVQRKAMYDHRSEGSELRKKMELKMKRRLAKLKGDIRLGGKVKTQSKEKVLQ